MDSNALFRNPLFKPKFAHKQGREEHSVGTITKPCHWDSIPKQVHQTKYANQRKRTFASNQSTIERHNTPRVYELDATLQHKLFDVIDKNRRYSPEMDNNRSIGRVFSIPSVIQNNVVVETNKPRIIQEHVGGSTGYPNSKIGETLLKQQALTSLTTTFPDSLSKLNKKLAELIAIKADSNRTLKTNQTLPTKPPVSSTPPAQNSTPLSHSSNSGYETPNETEDMDVDEKTGTPPSTESQQATEDAQNYRVLLTKLTRIKSRISRNRTSLPDETTMNYLREYSVIEPNDVDRPTISAKIDTAIAKLENHLANLPMIGKRKAGVGEHPESPLPKRQKDTINV